jgi:nucleoside-diphosphate-sugar epimerase
MGTFLVGGGGGYIGTELTQQLLEAGHRVICLDRVFFGKDLLCDFVCNPNYTLVRDDIRTFDPDILKGVDVVIDLAGISNDPACDLKPSFTEEVNWKGCVRVATLAKEMGVRRYILASSCSVYGHGANIGLTEDSPVAPVSLYAVCKVRTEDNILALGSGGYCVTVLRNATVYGSSRRMRYDLVVNLMTAKAFEENRVYVLGGGHQYRPNVHVRDVARAFILVMSEPTERVAGKIFNVGSNCQTLRVIDIAHCVREAFPTVEILVVPDDPDKRSYHVNFDRISVELGFSAVYSIAEGIDEIKQGLMRGTILGLGDPRTKTLGYYSWLIKAKETLDDVCLGGRLF